MFAILVVVSVLARLIGLMGRANLVAMGSSSYNVGTRFGPGSTFAVLAPVRLPPGFSGSR
jgi:hypothetical protein